MSMNKYQDLQTITSWINNQRNYEKHLKHLQDKKRNINKLSESQFGIREETMINLYKLRDKVYQSHIMKVKEKNLDIERNDHFLNKKLDSIKRRDNKYLLREIEFNYNNQKLRNRSDNLREIRAEKIFKENQFIEKRIINKNSAYQDIFEKTFEPQQHQQFPVYKKFDLPHIEKIAKNYSIFPKINQEYKEKVILETWNVPQEEKNPEKKKKHLSIENFEPYSFKKSFEKLNNFNTLNSLEKNDITNLKAKLKKSQEIKEIIRDYKETNNRVDTGKTSRGSSRFKKMRVSKSNNIL